MTATATTATATATATAPQVCHSLPPIIHSPSGSTRMTSSTSFMSRSICLPVSLSAPARSRNSSARSVSRRWKPTFTSLDAVLPLPCCREICLSTYSRKFFTPDFSLEI